MKKYLNWIGISTMMFLFVAGLMLQGDVAKAAERVCHIEISADRLGTTSTLVVEGQPVTISTIGVRDGIQKAFDYAKSLNNINGASYDSIEVKFKRGQYNVDGTLFLYSNTNIVCEDGVEVRSVWQYGTLLRSAPLRLLGNATVSNEMVKNISVIGGKWNGMNKPGTIFRFTHTSNVMISGVEVANLKDTGHLVALEAVNNVTIQNSKFYGHSISAGAKETDSSEAIHIDFTRGAADISKAEENDIPCTNIVVQNNEIHDVPTGVGSHTAMNGVTHKNISILNNNIYNTKGFAVRIYRYRNVTVQGNRIDNAAGAISINTKGTNVYTPNKNTVKEADNNISGITVSLNVITNIKGNAIWLTGSADYPHNGVAITQNTLNTVTQTAVTIRDYCNNTLVEGNTILNSGQYAIQANNRCNRLTVNSNIITNSKKHAIAVRSNCNNSTITNNGLNGLSESGIVVYTNSNNATITGNAMNQPKADGILVKENCKNAVVSNNMVVNPNKCGITVMNKVDTVSISGNTITNAKGTAISLKDNVVKATISSNTITNAKDSSILLTNKCNNAKIMNNKVSGGTFGVLIRQNCSKALVKSNTFNNTKKNSIHVMNKCNNGTISYNKINNSKANGIYIVDKSVKTKVTNNTITKVANNGISVQNGADQTTVTNNTIKDAKVKGLYSKGVKKFVDKKNKLVNCKK